MRIPLEDGGLMSHTGVGERPEMGTVRRGYRSVPPYRALFSDNLETMLVRVTTDEGISGIGEAQAPIGPEVAQSIVKHLLGPLLIGADPLDRDVLWDRMFGGLRDRGHPTGFALDAIAALDIALWDVAGKALGLPISKLMGGAYRDRLPAYVSGVSGKTREARRETILSYREQGFSAFKLFIGHGVREDVAELAAAREAAGDDATLMADAHWMYDVPAATALGRELERLSYAWLEAPLQPEDVSGHAKLAAALDIAIAVGEPYRSRYEFLPFFEARALEVAQPDVGRAGGLSECRKIAAMAETYSIPIAPHQGYSLGVYIAAAVQLAAAIPNFLIMEFQPSVQQWSERMLTEPPRYRAGAVEVPDRPGLGTDLRWDLLAPYMHE